MRFARLDAGFVQLSDKEARALDHAPWLGGRPTGTPRPWSEAELQCPVVPSKIVCVGRNYAAHAKELGNEVPAEPLLFFKPPSALVGPNAHVVLPKASAKVEHEAELGVIIGKRCSRVSRENALDHVFGYTCVNDVTARDLQRKDGQWARAKGFDTFCPTGPWIETELDPARCDVTCRVNGELRQSGNTSQMMFDVAHILSYVSHIMTLEPGDLIATGTPEGVSPLHANDVVEVSVSGIGTLRSPVAE